MIRNCKDFDVKLAENMRGGEGTVTISNFVTAEELNNKGRLFGKILLKPGCSIGFHTHENESELFYILKGTAVYDDNGTKTTVCAGDVTLTPAGTGHGIKNESSDDVELIALIIYAN